jgi:dTDP-glucose 4,6-dehydratase
VTTCVITGGAGFIGSALVRRALARGADRVVVVDKLTYAGSRANLDEPLADQRVSLVVADIGDEAAMTRLFEDVRPEAVLNLAAETHVDRSIDDPGPFLQTNTVGAFALLECARRYWKRLPDGDRERFRFLHVSTDEVYGTLGTTGLFTEETPYAPNSPYAASKAAADHFVRAAFHTYGVPTLITNCSNNYGPRQFPEKLIPLMILNALHGEPLPIYGDGGNVRDWLHVDDHCDGILLALEKGEPGGKYNIGGSGERTNLQIVDTICETLEALRPSASNPALGGRRYRDLRHFVADRPGHDRRYAIDATRIREALGWRPAHTVETGLRDTIQWYLDHEPWWREIQAKRYQRQRLGLG